MQATILQIGLYFHVTKYTVTKIFDWSKFDWPFDLVIVT